MYFRKKTGLKELFLVVNSAGEGDDNIFIFVHSFVVEGLTSDKMKN